MPRGPRLLRPVKTGRLPTEHACAGGLCVVFFAANARRARPHTIDRGFSARHCVRTTAVGCNPRGHSFRTLCRAARARFAPWRTGRQPTEHLALADLACLSSRPTRAALHPSTLAKVLPHRHRARSAADGCKRRDHSIRSPCRAACARFAPRSTVRPPTEHAHGGGLGVVVFSASARRAPPHAVGRDSSAPTPRQVGDCGFGCSWP